MTAEAPEPTAPAPAPASYSGAVSESPGTLIRAARERARMTLEELAGHTKLARTTIDALERDDFAALLEPVYVRGYYRKCAKVLSLPEAQLMDAYASRVQPKPLSPPTKLRLGTGSEVASSPRLGMILVIGVVLILLVALVWYLRGGKASLVPAGGGAAPTAQLPAATLDPSAAPVADASDNAVSAPRDVPAADAPVATPAASAAAATGLSPKQEATEASATPATAVAPADSYGSPLTLNFVSISWARVEDASGRVMLNRVVQAGERQVLDGRPPYAVFLGNAPGVQVSYQGAAVDIKALIRDSATARFAVPLAAPAPAAPAASATRP